MAHVICIVSQKGGTGKTTSSVNIAGALALFEKRTLLIDCDPLGNATTGLGIDKDALPRTLYHALTGRFAVEDVIRSTDMEFLNIVPARFELLEVEKKLSLIPDCESRLRMVLGAVLPDYDYIIIDSPPSLNFLAISAITSADWLLIPMQCQMFTLEGLGQLLAIAREIKARHNPGLRIAGVLFTMCENAVRVPLSAPTKSSIASPTTFFEVPSHGTDCFANHRTLASPWCSMILLPRVQKPI